MEFEAIFAQLTDLLNQAIAYLQSPEFADILNSVIEFIKGLFA